MGKANIDERKQYSLVVLRRIQGEVREELQCWGEGGGVAVGQLSATGEKNHKWLGAKSTSPSK